MRNLGVLAGIALAPVFAQPADVFEARITKTASDRGKCTIEVVVDGTAEIEIRGLVGRIRTISGVPTTWRRMDCNEPLPADPVNFRFRGQEGRGRQYLLREPQQNRGAALVRIEDADGGREGYKFDLEWFGSGAGRGFPGGGYDGPVSWNRQIDFRGNGDGYYRDFRGRDDLLRDCRVTIDRRGVVRVEFQTNRRERFQLIGRLVRADKRRLVADINDGRLQGTMDLVIDNRDRVREIAMNGGGRSRFELRWNDR